MSNMQQKKITKEDEPKRSGDLHLYSIVEENFKDKYPNKTEGLYTELITNTNDNPQAIYSSLQKEKLDSLVANKSMSDYNQSKKGKSVYQISLCLIILALLLLVLISLITSVVISFVMKTSINGDNQGNCNSTSSNEDFMNILKRNTKRISAIEKELNEYRKSELFSFNATYLENIITDDLDLLVLLNQLKESRRIEYASLNDKISHLNRSIHFGKAASFPAPSCRVIYLLQPNYRSGHYWVISSNGSSIRVYCEMTKSCGNVTGGLIRVGVLNSETRPLLCIGDFTTVNHNTRCVRTTAEPGCSHMVFPLMNMEYSHICGTVEAFWFSTPDGFTGSSRSSSTTINDNYVDGISLTYGNTSNRTHIWTFIADGYFGRSQNCPRQVPKYVGPSCLTSSCSSSPNSCTHTFFRQLQQPVTEDIEMRLCRDGHRDSDDEGIYVVKVEIYVL